MSKPYLIINLIEGKVGVIRERDTFDEAVAIATAMAAEQCGVESAEIQQELETDHNFVPNGGGFEVVIAQANDD